MIEELYRGPPQHRQTGDELRTRRDGYGDPPISNFAISMRVVWIGRLCTYRDPSPESNIVSYCARGDD